jgi:hypothetical protein
VTRAPSAAIGLVAVALAAAALASCGEGARRVASPTLQDPPLGSVAVDGAGLTAAVAMGDLSSPADTFWQLLYRPDRSGRWTLLTPPGTATNGGVVVAPSDGGAVTTGVLASLKLTFSPLASTSNLGGDWTTAVLPGPLAAAPSTLALDGARVLALLGTDRGEIVESRSALAASSWTTVVDAATLRQVAGSRCSVVALTALAVVNATVIAGARCATHRGAGSTTSPVSGSMPLFARIDGAWVTVGPTLPGSSEVLRLAPVPGGLVAIVEYRQGSAAVVEVLRLADGLRTVDELGAWPVGAGAVVSSTVDRAGVTTVVVRPPHGACEAEVFGLPDARAFPGRVGAYVALPPGACVLVWGASGVQALRVEGSTLVVYGVGRTHRWEVVQRLDVPIQFGSSS